jgi:hypothetical protein
MALRRRAALVVVLMSVTSVYGSAQTPAGAQAYRAPRTTFGQPDLQGVWQAINTAVWNIQDHSAQLGIPAGQGIVEGDEIPYRPEALARQRENFKNRLTADPEAKCFMVGVPRINYMPYPFEIVQTPTQITLLYEYVHTVRNIRLNSQHPEGPIEFFMGDSRGRWDGDTLVADVIHFSDQTWFDRSGNFHSADLHVVERYARTGPDHIAYEATIEDPKTFTRPWKISMPLYRRQEKNIQLLEYECQTLLEAEKERRGDYDRSGR